MKLTLPLCIFLPRVKSDDKKIILNMNVYRNMGHFNSAAAKLRYNILMEAELERLEGEKEPRSVYEAPPYRFTYTLFPVNGSRMDVANVLSIVDKFTCDALVEMGVIPDDNFKIVKEVVYRYGSVDKENPRAELEITSI